MANNDFTYPPPQPQGPFSNLGMLSGLQGMFGGLRRGYQAGNRALHPYSNRLLLTGMGLLSRDKDAMGQAMKGMIAGSALDTEDADRTKLNKAIQGLMDDTSGTGLLAKASPAEKAYLLASPPTLSRVMADQMSPPSAGVNINMGEYKPPVNYRWKDPENRDAGVEPIPGGPGEEMPAEVAARIGLADSFIAEAPALRKRIIGGEATGPYDVAQAGWNSSSTQAEVKRKILSGIDSMKRMLSGAGLPVAEQAEYEYRYLPGYTDDAPSAAQKLDQLTKELKQVKEVVMRGRGGKDNPPTLEELNQLYGVD